MYVYYDYCVYVSKLILKLVYILCPFFLFYDVKKTGNKSRNRDYRANNLVGELNDSKKNCESLLYNDKNYITF